jgi:hypothetical protein
MYYESHLRNGIGIERKPFADKEGYSPLQFGSRGHELMEERYKAMQGQAREPYPPSPIELLELEAMMVMAGYENHYAFEHLDIVDVERTVCVPLNADHNFIGKMDLVVRQENGTLDIIDHKFQTRSAKSNLPQKWAARDQATLYLWALGQLYDAPIGNFYVNAVTRPSEKGMIPPTFPERQKLERTQEQIRLAVRDMIWVADQISEMKAKFGDEPWPASRENCFTYSQCEFYQIHTFGVDEGTIKIAYQPKTPYLYL